MSSRQRIPCLPEVADIVSVGLLLVFHVSAPLPLEAAQERVVGLLTIPELFGHESCEKFVPAEVPLYRAPESERVGFIRVKDKEGTPPECWLPATVHLQGDSRVSRMATREYAYEAAAAIVLEQRGRWFKVRLPEGSVMTHSICESIKEEPKVAAEGWLPAHSPTGEPSVWFYSRGC